MAGVVPTTGDGALDLMKHFSKSELKELSKGTCYALVAAEEALTDAGWKPQSSHEQERTGELV